MAATKDKNHNSKKNCIIDEQYYDYSFKGKRIFLSAIRVNGLIHFGVAFRNLKDKNIKGDGKKRARERCLSFPIAKFITGNRDTMNKIANQLFFLIGILLNEGYSPELIIKGQVDLFAVLLAKIENVRIEKKIGM